MKKSFLSLLIVLFSCAAISAQTSAFTYQGRLNDGASPASGVYEVEFALYDAASGGTQVGCTVTNSSVTVTNGSFTVSLDFGAEAFTGADRYLEISVKKPSESSFTTLSPRQQVASVPYALNAAKVNATSGDSVVAAINDAATTTTISENRLPANLFRLQPSSTQMVDSSDVLTPVFDFTGRRDESGGNFSEISRFRVSTDGGFLAAGTQDVGAVPTSGAGSRMMWYPGKYAFRAGKVDSFGATYWDESLIGYGSIALGENVRASGNNSFAANLATTASGNESVALGNNGAATADRSFAFNGTASGVGAVAIGSGAQATNDDALALGPSSIAGGLASIVIGPSIANGNFGVAIGLQNSAAGDFSVAIGKNARACSVWDCAPGTARRGAIVISDACAGFSSDGLTASADNQVNIRGCGGFRFFTNQSMTAGVTMEAGGGSWNSLSDRNMKENFATVNSRDVLRKVLNLPISTWNYKSQDKSIRHIGAMAQDFYAAFGVGENDKTIATIDPDGVAFAAIQGLNEKLDERALSLEKENSELKKQLAAQQEQLNRQQAAIDALKKLICAGKSEAEACRQ